MDLGSTFWPGDLFGVKNGSRKTYFYYEMILSWGFRGIPVTQMNSMVHGTHLGVLLCPKPWFFNYFWRISRFSGKLVGPWDPPCVSPIALRGPIALFPLFGVYDGFIVESVGTWRLLIGCNLGLSSLGIKT